MASTDKTGQENVTKLETDEAQEVEANAAAVCTLDESVSTICQVFLKDSLKGVRAVVIVHLLRHCCFVLLVIADHRDTITSPGLPPLMVSLAYM